MEPDRNLECLAILGLIYRRSHNPNDGPPPRRSAARKAGKEERSVASLVEATAPFSRRVYVISHPVSSALVERNGERIIYASLLLWL